MKWMLRHLPVAVFELVRQRPRLARHAPDAWTAARPGPSPPLPARVRACSRQRPRRPPAVAAHGLPPARCWPERPERPREPGDGVCVRARPSSEEPRPVTEGSQGLLCAAGGVRAPARSPVWTRAA